MPLFVRVVDSLEHTSTFKSRKVDLREQGYGADDRGSAVRAGGPRRGYVPFYDAYPDEVAAGAASEGLSARPDGAQTHRWAEARVVGAISSISACAN